MVDNGSVRCFFPPNLGLTHKLQSIQYSVEPESGVAVAAYNTPGNLNALTQNQMMETFLVLEDAARDPLVRCLVWTGNGDRAFCAGAALKGDGPPTVDRAVVQAYAAESKAPDNTMVLANQVRAFWDFPKPLVMAVNGMAVGGGANIALMNLADLVICSRSARFKYPFAKLGFTPELFSSRLMPLAVGMAKAKEMFMLGDWFSADDALQWGLCNKVVPHEQLMPEAMEWARRLAANDPNNMRHMKTILNAPLRRELDAVLKHESETIKKSFSTFSRGRRTKGGAGSMFSRQSKL